MNIAFLINMKYNQIWHHFPTPQPFTDYCLLKNLLSLNQILLLDPDALIHKRQLGEKFPRAKDDQLDR